MRKLSDRRGHYGVGFQTVKPAAVNFADWWSAGSFMCVGYGPDGDTALRRTIQHLAEIGFDAEWLCGTMSIEYLLKFRAPRTRRVYCIVWFDKEANGIAYEPCSEDE